MLKFLPESHQDALLLAAQYSTLACMQELLEKFSINFHYVDKKENNVLHRIMMRDQGQQDKITMLELFFDNGQWHGLDINARNSAGQTILDMVTTDEVVLAEYLESKGAWRTVTFPIENPSFILQYEHFQLQQESLLAPQITTHPTVLKDKFKL